MFLGRVSTYNSYPFTQFIKTAGVYSRIQFSDFCYYVINPKLIELADLVIIRYAMEYLPLSEILLRL